MKAKHTKGKWGLQRELEVFDKVCGLDTLEVHTRFDDNKNLPQWIAKVRGDSLEETLANAKLMAAAPDLLDVVIELDSIINNLGLNLPSDFLIKFEQAIKKATD